MRWPPDRSALWRTWRSLRAVGAPWFALDALVGTRVDNRGISDKELSELLAPDQLGPLLGSRHGLDTAEDSMEVIATEIAELVALDDELVTVESD